MCTRTRETEINSSYDIDPSIHAYNLKSIHPKKGDKIIMGHRRSSVYWNLTQGEVEVSHQATNPLPIHLSIHLVFHPSTHRPSIYTFLASHPSILKHGISTCLCPDAARQHKEWERIWEQGCAEARAREGWRRRDFQGLPEQKGNSAPVPPAM